MVSRKKCVEGTIRESGRLDLHEVLLPQDSCYLGEVPSADRDESLNSANDKPRLLNALSIKRGNVMQIDEGVVSQIRSKISFPQVGSLSKNEPSERVSSRRQA